ncbi:MAG: hypothetical protein ACKOFD_00990, partial [Actinomycetota bacterium]
MPRIPTSARGARFIGWGTALGHETVTNHDLEQKMDTSDEWIRERTGIERRHIGGSNVELSTESGRRALEMAGVDPLSIDALVLATTTPDRGVPGTSASVQHSLGLKCGAFDVNAACSGFVYSLVTAHGLIAMGAERVLLIGTDILSRITDWNDRNTAILFADGSGAAVLQATSDSGHLLAGTSMPMALLRICCTKTTATSSRWTARKCSDVPFASWLTAPRRASRMRASQAT